MAFTTGMQALKDAIKAGQEKAAAREASGGGSSLNYFSWKAGDKKIIRFLTDDILTEDFYLNIICKDGKTRSFLADPTDPDRLRRYMSPTPGIGWKKEFSGEIVEPYSSRQTVNIAVLREEVLQDGKMVVRDHVYEREINGQKYPSRFFGIVQQAISNFWEPLTVSVYERYGSICDRDLEVIRSGAAKNTNYSFMPLQVVTELASAEAVAAAYFYGAEWNAEDPDRFLKCPMTLQQWATYFSGEERYTHWLTPNADSAAATSTVAGVGLGEFHPQTTSNPDEAQAVAPANSQFATLRDSLIADARKAQS